MNFTFQTENDRFPVIKENIQRKVKMSKLGSFTQGSKDRSKILKVIFVLVWSEIFFET